LSKKVTTNRRRSEAQYFAEDLGNGVTLEMVAIPDGTFQMGSPESEAGRDDDESPQHQVTVKPFFLGKYSVTQAQWQAVAKLPKVSRELDPNPSRFKGADRPVEQVSWHDAVEFCARLSKQTGREYRLPSEAEWEYACRAGTTTPFHFGETITTDLVNYRGTDFEYKGTVYRGSYGSGSKGEFRHQTTPVGSFGVANAFGLYDMHGNVWEWCADHWHDNYEGAPSDGSAWLSDNDNQYRIVRGGSCFDFPSHCRSASRYGSLPGNVDLNFGFRVVCELPRTL
jgi:formylglycine-generating enzyme required for sulfatase activity